MIKNIDGGVRRVTINTTTLVPVQLYNNRGKVIAMSEAQRVNDLSPSTLSMIGVSPTDQSAERQFVPQTTPHRAANSHYNNQGHAMTMSEAQGVHDLLHFTLSTVGAAPACQSARSQFVRQPNPSRPADSRSVTENALMLLQGGVTMGRDKSDDPDLEGL